jgi:pimeloyl-ACP methyl ester carboxylesterase
MLGISKEPVNFSTISETPVQHRLSRMSYRKMAAVDLVPSTCKQIRLDDGRLLAYAEYGDPQGKPVIFFHGTPGSRLFHHPDESIALSLGIRIIAPDRPGFGLSDSKVGRTLLDWPDDVVQLADTLHIDRFAVAGMSGGGSYVTACALKIPHRLTRAALISSIAPLSAPEATRGHLLFSLARNSPTLAALSWWLMNLAYHRNPDRFFNFEAGLTSESEKVLLKEPDVKSLLIQDYAEAVRDGISGIASEMVLLAHPWGFRLENIAMEIHLWHGAQDVRTPIAMGRYLANTIPICRATFLAAEGHGVIYHHWREILSALTSSAASEDSNVESQKKPRRRLKRPAAKSQPEGTDVPTESRPTRRQSKPTPARAPRKRKQLTTAGSKDTVAT